MFCYHRTMRTNPQASASSIDPAKKLRALKKDMLDRYDATTISRDVSTAAIMSRLLLGSEKGKSFESSMGRVYTALLQVTDC